MTASFFRANWKSCLPILLLLCASCKTGTNNKTRTVTIVAMVPADTDTVYITGNRPELGDWDPHGLAMSGTGRERSAVLHLPPGTQLEFKFTLGSWEREALEASGKVGPNHRLLVDADTVVKFDIPGFNKRQTVTIADWKSAGVLGRLEYWTNVSSQFLALSRNVEIWLPPGYDDSTNRYDVLYMHDGQNLFDPRLSFSGAAWGVDQAIVRGMNAGKLPPLIVVGVWNTTDRLREYSPWDEGTNYGKFLIDELMPRVNAQYRTLTGPQHTAVMGSSMGGLISFWLCWKNPQVFGSAACLSTSFTWKGHIGRGGSPLIKREIAAGGDFPPGIRFYFDYGTGHTDIECKPAQRKVNAWLTSRGLTEGKDFVVHEIPGADHNEAAWRARLDLPLDFLYGSAAR
jgi:enterochelin esterase-like enzyme